MSFIPKIGTPSPQENPAQSPVVAGAPKGGVKVMPTLPVNGGMPLLKKQVALAPKEASVPAVAEAGSKRALPLPKKQTPAAKASVPRAQEAPVATSPRVVPPKEPKQIGKLVMPTFKNAEAPKAEIADLPKGRVSELRNVVGAQLMKSQPPVAMAEPDEADILVYAGPDQEVKDDIIELPRADSPSSDDDIVYSPFSRRDREDSGLVLVSVEAYVEEGITIRNGHVESYAFARLSVSVTPLNSRPVFHNPFLPF